MYYAKWREMIKQNYIFAKASAIKARFPLPEFTARIFDTRQLGPSTRVSKNAPEFTGRQLTRPWTRVVETGLN